MLGISSFQKNPKNTCYDGEDHDEKILYVVRQSTLTTIPWLFMVGVLAAIPLFLDPFLRSFRYNNQPLVNLAFLTVLTLFWWLFTFGFFLFNFLNWFFNVYIITNKKIVDIDFHGLIYKNISEATLFNIEDVTSVVKGAANMIFNIGDVYIQTAGEIREFDFMNVHNPSKLRDIISDLVAEKRHNGNN